jgi:hypothetical protein
VHHRPFSFPTPFGSSDQLSLAARPAKLPYSVWCASPLGRASGARRAVSPAFARLVNRLFHDFGARS